MFNPLSEDLKAQRAAHSDNRPHDGGVISMVGDIIDKAFVDLERIDGKAFEVAIRGVAGTKIVNGQMDAPRTQSVQHLYHLLLVLHHGTFGEFERELVGGESALAQG